MTGPEMTPEMGPEISPGTCDCSDALSHVYDYLDGEVEDNRRRAIARHLDECPPCREQFDLEQVVKSLVHRCCCSERAPETLRVRIVARISEVRITYRRQP
jgi:mycothiol system anti-sigma-R factor